MKNIIKKKYIIIVCVALALVVAHACYTNGPQHDAATARAVATLLSRSTISDGDLSIAMDISGVRDAYVIRKDGSIGLPARRRGDVAHPDSEGSAIVPLDENERIVVEAYEQSQPQQMPLFLLLPLAVAGVLLVLRRRTSANGKQHKNDATEDVLPRDSIGIDLASSAADAALIRVDTGCRVVAASNQAKRSYGVTKSSGHIVDILHAEEVQKVLQLIRRCDREGSVTKDLSWRGADLRFSVLKDGSGFLLKLSKELCDEIDA